MGEKWESWVSSLEGPYRETVDHREYQTANAAYLNQLEADKAALLEALEKIVARLNTLRTVDFGNVGLAEESLDIALDVLSHFRSEGAEVKAGE